MSAPDLSEFRAFGSPKKKPCPVRRAMEQLSREDRVALQAACDVANAADITPGAIQKWLLSRGHGINVQAVAAHRRNQCTCGDA